jgi:hypothetical protein
VENAPNRLLFKKLRRSCQLLQLLIYITQPPTTICTLSNGVNCRP